MCYMELGHHILKWYFDNKMYEMYDLVYQTLRPFLLNKMVSRLISVINNISKSDIMNRNLWSTIIIHNNIIHIIQLFLLYLFHSENDLFFPTVTLEDNSKLKLKRKNGQVNLQCFHNNAPNAKVYWYKDFEFISKPEYEISEEKS